MAKSLMKAHSILNVQSMKTIVREGKEYGIIEGMATTPTPDRLGDIIEPKGAKFELPLPMLWQHSSWDPIGLWTEADVRDDGIEVLGEMPLFAQSKKLKERIEEAWESAVLGLVRGLSIGFNPDEYSIMKDTYSFHFLTWEWLENSLVTIPANAEATIENVKLFDNAQRRGIIPRVAPDSPASEHVVRLSADVKRRASLAGKGSILK